MGFSPKAENKKNVGVIMFYGMLALAVLSLNSTMSHMFKCTMMNNYSTPTSQHAIFY
ncbi:MAG: hypothetical protein LM600_00545 [Thaumarchaeota archaeon]|jgi:hypothetical protein|nr:hypothetical protein [Nitrososphaerota archaeon]